MFRVHYKDKQFNIYCPFAGKDFMRMLKARWLKGKKCWALPFTIDIYQKLCLLNGVQMSDKIHNHFKEKLNNIISYDKEFPYKTKPYSHQKALTNLFIQKKKAFAFADPGTGKSKAAIDAAVALHLERKVFKVAIICPASLIPNWAEEVRVHSHFEAVELYGKVDKRLERLNENNVLFYVINYDIVADYEVTKEVLTKNPETGVKEPKEVTERKMSVMGQAMLDQHFDMIVFDECHFMKGRNSYRSTACMKIARTIKYRIGLTGTMVANRPNDIFMPYKIVDPEIFGSSYTKFKEEFLVMGGFDAGFGPTQVLGIRNEEELQSRVALNALRFDLDDVVDLPKQIHKNRLFRLDPGTQAIYDEIVNESTITWQDIENSIFEEKVIGNTLEEIIRRQQAASGFIPKIQDFTAIKNEYIEISNEKIEVLKDIVEELLNSGEKKIIIWCKFKPSIRKVEKLIKDLKLSYYIYDGDQKNKKIYLDYQKDDTVVWVGQLQTGIGYSIPCARHAIYYELNHSYGDWKQSKGRNRRLVGSTEKSCVYWYLMAKGTIDEDLLPLIKRKEAMEEKVLKKVKGGKDYVG